MAQTVVTYNRLDCVLVIMCVCVCFDISVCLFLGNLLDVFPLVKEVLGPDLVLGYLIK